MAHIEKEEGQLTKFVFDDTADESSLLSLAANNASVAATIPQQQKEEQIKQMLWEGKTRREICSELRVGSNLVCRIKKYMDEMKTTTD